jgi:hydrogenase maturation protease
MPFAMSGDDVREISVAGKRVLVLGLGNPILTDDGVGVKAAEKVFEALPPGAPVEVREVSVGGLTLMEHMVGWEKVVLIDALQTGSSPYGAVRRMTVDERAAMSPTQHSASPHDASLITALAFARRMELDLPEDIVIYAVEVENVLDFGELPTPAVAEAIPVVARMVLAQLAQWDIIAGEVAAATSAQTHGNN